MQFVSRTLFSVLQHSGHSPQVMLLKGSVTSYIQIYRWGNSYSAQESFLSGTAASYLESMYNLWLEDPSKVHPSWDEFFKKVAQDTKSGQMYPPLPSQRSNVLTTTIPAKMTTSSGAPLVISEKSIENHLKIQNIIRAYQVRGHLHAQVDPLGISFAFLDHHFVDRSRLPQERVAQYMQASPGDASLDELFILPTSTYIGGSEKILSLREILKRLEAAYCRYIGVEYMYIPQHAKCDWIRSQFEVPQILEKTREEKRTILFRLIKTVGFEAFLARKWSAEKRFGIEGCEMLIPAVQQIIDRASTQGVDVFIIGMPHRGRLNVLANICTKPLNELFTQFTMSTPTDTGSGDVKYHLGTHIEKTNSVTGRRMTLSLVANPSHLEAVGPVVQGRTRAEQFKIGDVEGKKVMSIIMHGDAAFCGEGVVYETFHLSDLPHYTTHGTIHIVVNNQVGFTTDPRFSRSSVYCTDVARVVHAPIFHVNADQPEDVIHCCNVATDYRQKFQSDVVIDLVGYRRNGHNEADEPAFTQPLMYKTIRSMKTVLDKYSAKLITEQVVTDAEIQQVKDDYEKLCDEEYKKSQKDFSWKDWIDCPWKGFFTGKDLLVCQETGVPEDILTEVGMAVSTPPPKELEFEIHKGLERVLKGRLDMVKERRVDWALAEMMAFGALLKEGHYVRVSGQDVERGTFSHRHHVLHHQSKDKEVFVPLQHIFPSQAPYTICNSSISEYAVLGFELGFALSDPQWLVIWEAQFGDFVNNGQAILDTFLAAGEDKWARQCSLVLYLPHGMEGMGPEHSSGHLARKLLLCNDDPDALPDLQDPQVNMRQLKDVNWIIANCSTPANFFHILRRQLALPFRKPLILFSPKSLLRHPQCKSSFDEMLVGRRARRKTSSRP
ncbi:2-oxoglutarate dehydrogenase complex component E1 isoform X2 [Anabrus simplex]|uniref:2-oxoglutarate dehydrogenase complex component E1 isoform X2 n=1 Tax=Anabrus simplex TaxID=316456 RepID=UPI0034DDB014